MLTIGFAKDYYTLWSVTSVERYDSYTKQTYLRTTYNYIQNLSLNLDQAKEKVIALSEEYEVDLTLKGESRNYWTERMIKASDPWFFTFGKLVGQDIRTSLDVWQLQRAMKEEAGMRRKVYARRRLIELGELVKYKWEEKTLNFKYINEEESEMCVQMIVRNYCPIKLKEAIEKKKNLDSKSDHYYEQGKRIQLTLKLVKESYFETQYGVVYIQLLETEDGKIVKYKGTNPLNFKEVKNFLSAVGTVEHGEYKGVRETRLKRVKIIKQVDN